jgi:hypothetical protein
LTTLKYHQVESLPFVDGVFRPDGLGRVQLDSAGHSFEGFLDTTNETAACVWSRWHYPHYSSGKLMGAIPAKLGDVNYSSAGHGVVFLHPNGGITFDLHAIRRANPNCKLTRFLAVEACN